MQGRIPLRRESPVSGNLALNLGLEGHMLKSIFRGGVVGFVLTGIVVLTLSQVVGISFGPIAITSIFVGTATIGALLGANKALCRELARVDGLYQSDHKKVEGLESRVQRISDDHDDAKRQYLGATRQVRKLLEFVHLLIGPGDWQTKVDEHLGRSANVCAVNQERVRHYEDDRFEITGIGEASALLVAAKQARESLAFSTQVFGVGYDEIAEYMDTFRFKMRIPSWEAYAPKSEPPATEPVPEQPATEATPPDSGAEPDGDPSPKSWLRV
ncbi:MAG: hypothetical protein A2566_01335 [Candidatus Zambryskibacteria bacterium RIFOXYD1_FULL_40_13]|nr:MAG: hypothetical protein UT49_C0002G0014 [Parcubacteria group bacterium GW2011_GWF1_39_37]KKR34863.1 MAG: hypothetical protein UT68_C0007G0014 [Parcubacteria group bacterium GW2011_GWC2_40_10]KKR52145.1 MAG: hypothetical protein UT89_C0003G0081 [Parcubacteria group bacterium GW2011_GWE1_40_20]KKR68632.1 MAG: hypothetical protein UU11_C0008G0007 [Parcubacteria group bacterium GW2011_GWF2_40_69]KKS35696.1 MAG: hypothetical protein UU99_C0005G0028 [Parcubacteria group bacterium GW2011_GWE2_42_